MLPLLSHFRRTFADLGLILAASAIASTVVIGIRQMGWLQPLELGAYDRLMQLRPMPAPIRDYWWWQLPKPIFNVTAPYRCRSDLRPSSKTTPQT